MNEYTKVSEGYKTVIFKNDIKLGTLFPSDDKNHLYYVLNHKSTRWTFSDSEEEAIIFLEKYK